MQADEKKREPVHGWLIIDKPYGLTSTQTLGRARRCVGGKKVGHGGTLDPLATGLLPLAFGEATKLIPYVMDGEKTYEFTVHWGEQRTTDDAEGEVIARSERLPTPEAIQAALPAFLGPQSQKPPIYSALKVEGARAYDLARAGELPDLAPREIMINALEYRGSPTPEQAHFKVSCGKGTYVRALGRDLALFLGTYGYISALRRTRVGPFTVESSISLEKLEELSHNGAAKTALLALGAALDDIPGLPLSASEAQKLRHGQSLLLRPDQLDLMRYPALLATQEGEPVALVKAEAGSFIVLRGFHF